MDLNQANSAIYVLVRRLHTENDACQNLRAFLDKDLAEAVKDNCQAKNTNIYVDYEVHELGLIRHGMFVEEGSF